MRSRWLLLYCLVLLTGCGNRLATQAVRNAEFAIEEQLYERVNSLLHLAKVESSNREYEALHEQSIHLINMQKYKKANDLDSLLLTWTELNLISSDSSLIKEEAIKMLREMLEHVEMKAMVSLDEKSPQEMILFIRLIEKRMGTFKMFESEVQTLTALREQLEGVRIR